jgi:hypothetical protein
MIQATQQAEKASSIEGTGGWWPFFPKFDFLHVDMISVP